MSRDVNSGKRPDLVGEPAQILERLLNQTKHKENRWDRIRRKHLNSITVTSKTVKRFFNMDFVDEAQMRILSGNGCQKSTLNPMLVMDIRHEMIKRKPKETRSKPPLDPVRVYQQENLEIHNRTIESTLFENELSKFRTEISKAGTNGRKHQISEQKKSFLYIDLPKIDNSFIYDSLEECERFTNDFYQTAIRGTESFFDEELLIDRQPASIEEIIDEPTQMDSKISDQPQDNQHQSEIEEEEEEDEDGNKVVRFGDTQVITYPAEESSFSLDGSEYEYDDDELFLESLDSELDEFDDAEFLSVESTSEHTNEDHPQTNAQTYSSDDCFTVTRIEDSGGSSNNDSTDFGKEKLTYNYDEPEIIEEPVIPLDEADLIMVKRCEMDEKDYSKLRVTNYRPTENDDKIEISEESRKVISAALKEGFMQNYDRALLKQYFFKWLQFTILEKISKGAGVTSTREQKLKRINEFINNIRANKKKTPKPSAATAQATTARKDYEHRLKVQQDIIELQKLKLERQERIITELKLSKFSEAAKISKMEIQSELHKAMRTGHVRLRAKAKCIQIVGNIKNDTSEEDEQRKLQAQGLMIPKFLVKMQHRALERSQRHQEAKERRMRLEKEREDNKLAIEEAKRLEDEEARKKRYREMREKRKLEKLQKIIREQERQAWIANNQIAKEFRLIKLMRIGITAFKLLLGIRRDNERRAQVARKRYSKKKYFRKWWGLTNAVWESKKQKADGLAHSKLLKLGMSHWKEYCHEQRKKMQVAIDWWEVHITEKVISVWIGRTKQSLMVLQGKMSHAAAHYEWQLKWKVFERWQRLHIILKIEKETELRRQRWRMKIWELLPDYKPIEEEI
ncbi:calponin homology domain-containing protein DDB_G0272472 [Toxorhynchites rutilus septentrionalis]|uniref:calponin homology domain-containing protein DDB_G0272472 n=1 Tax=Toxorhynchites rutilus septentrionalis TaxID=329112 RepID=UPI00247967CB|nr:calponin homology domain-containing protein DDB_G0272472 [Toxorhynchites rutilus septentrionalis]